MYKPWIGPNYPETQLLILGESAYPWAENGKSVCPSPEHSTECAIWASCDFERCRTSNRFLTAVSRALANEESPTTDQLRAAWDRIAFTNFVSETVGEYLARPTPAMWAAAKRVFLPQLSEFFGSRPKPRRIIVIGKGIWKSMPDADIQIDAGVKGYRLADHIVMCFALPHTRAGLSWRQLANVVSSSGNAVSG